MEIIKCPHCSWLNLYDYGSGNIEKCERTFNCQNCENEITFTIEVKVEISIKNGIKD